jgi:hypothetical protein
MYERADVIGFANWQRTSSKTISDSIRRQARGVGTGERLLHLVERPAYIAKNRYGFPETIPLSWQAFSDALAAAMPQPAQQPIKAAKAA